MFWRIEIKLKENIFDALGAGIHRSVLDLGIRTISGVKVIQVYTIDGRISEVQVQTACRELLADHITQDYAYAAYDHAGDKKERSSSPFSATESAFSIETAYNPGVMDPVERSTIKGLRDLGIEPVDAVRTAKKYVLRGTASSKELHIITNKVLLNKLIQHVVQEPCPQKTFAASPAQRSFNLIYVDLIKAGVRQLKKISKDGQLYLNLDGDPEIF